MSEYKVIIISAIFSMLSAVIVALITGKINNRNAQSTDLREKRYKLYSDIIYQIDILRTLPNKIYENEYFSKICLEYKSYIKLYASNKTVKLYMDYLEYVYRYFSDGAQKMKNMSEKDKEDFILTNLPSVEVINKKSDSLINSMRRDIGNNKYQ